MRNNNYDEMLLMLNTFFLKIYDITVNREKAQITTAQNEMTGKMFVKILTEILYQ